MLADEVPGALERCAVHPACLESEGVQLLPKDLPDLLHAGMILGAAVDVDDPLEQRQRFVVVRVDKRHERLFVSVHSRRL